jgi:hypothetical protein
VTSVRPVPPRDVSDGVKLGVSLGPRVLLGDTRAELEVSAHRLPEGLVAGQACLVEPLQVHTHEAVALLVGDLQVAVDVDDVLEAQPLGEAVGAAERLGGEPGQVVDMGRYPFPELCLQDRVGQDLVVEQSFEAVKRLVTAGMFIQGLWMLHLAGAANRARAGTLITGVAHLRVPPFRFVSLARPAPARCLHGPASAFPVNDGLAACPRSIDVREDIKIAGTSGDAVRGEVTALTRWVPAGQAVRSPAAAVAHRASGCAEELAAYGGDPRESQQRLRPGRPGSAAMTAAHRAREYYARCVLRLARLRLLARDGADAPLPGAVSEVGQAARAIGAETGAAGQAAVAAVAESRRSSAAVFLGARWRLPVLRKSPTVETNQRIRFRE